MNDMLLPVADPSLTFAVDRPLTMEDIGDRKLTTNSTPLKRITDRHHALARAIASGTPLIDVSVIFSMSYERVKQLKEDPSFRELVNYYHNVETVLIRSTSERMAETANAGIDLVNEILDDEERRAKLSLGQALEVVKTFADRSGNGPQTTSVQVNIHANLADRLKAARERAAEAAIDITPQHEDAA